MKKLILFLILASSINLGLFTQPEPSRTIDGKDAGLVLERVPEVWAEGYYGEGVLIASIDEDFNWDHPDIVHNIWNNLGEDINGNGVTIVWNGTRWVYDSGDLNNLDDDGNGYVDDLIGWNFVNNNNILTRNDATSHGTQVAGVLVGDGTNGTKTGIAPQAELMLLRIGTNSEQEQHYAWEAMQYCIDMGVDIISQSQSFHWDDTWYDENMQNPGPPDVAKWRQLAEAELQAGIIHFSSISNDGMLVNQDGLEIPFNISVPGNCPPPWLQPEQSPTGGLSSIVGVGNLDTWHPDEIHSTSPYGPSSQEDYTWYYSNARYMPLEYCDYPYSSGGLLKPDISAYGAGTESINGVYPNFTYDGFSGTSSATPHAAGVAALLLSVNHQLTPSQLLKIISTSSIDNGSSGWDNRFGAGTVDAYNAYLMALDEITNVLTDEDAELVDYQLFQNYPNPFNPTTKIKYSLAKSGLVTICIYNCIGEQVEILVNENKSPGNFAVEFNGSNLPSGVYFYKLQTGNYIDVRKMILLK